MTVTAQEISSKIAQIKDIVRQKEELNAKYKELEAFFLRLGSDKLQNSKRKTQIFEDDYGRTVAYTEAKSVKIISPAVLHQLLGDAYDDFVKEENETKYTFKNKELERVFGGVYSAVPDVPANRLTLDEFFEQLPCDAVAKQALRKKLKGASFATDTKSLISIGGFDEDDAADYAYLFAESLIWDRFMTVAKIVGSVTEMSDTKDIIRAINSAIAVSDTTKITV